MTIQQLEARNRSLYFILSNLEEEVESKKRTCLLLDFDEASRNMRESFKKAQTCDKMISITKTKEFNEFIGGFKVTKILYGSKN